MTAKLLNSLSRRMAIAFGLALPFAARAESTPADGVAELVARASEANDAFIRGDMRAWYARISPLGDDFTLMQPFGGPTSRGFDASDEHLADMARRFTAGTATLELEQAYAVPGMVVLALIERQRSEVGGLPEQDWSLRVTLAFAKRNGAWHLVHRHADPLTRNIGLERAAAIARGDG